MNQYRVFFLGPDGRVSGVSAALFHTDADAGDWARSLGDSRAMELWRLDRRVEIIGAQDHRAGPSAPLSQGSEGSQRSKGQPAALDRQAALNRRR